MSDTHFDVLILGTALGHSIAAAALAKAGLRVLHVDPNAHYGGPHAALTPDELAEHPWTVLNTPHPVPNARQYSISLAPAVIRSTGPFIDAIVRSGVFKYGSYKLLDSLALFHATSATIRPVPGSKEDIFRAPDLSLLEKRRLMKFLLFAAQFNPEQSGLDDNERVMSFKTWLNTKFGLGEDMQDAVAYALALGETADDLTHSALSRIRSFIDATGRYGNSPFLVAYYGGLGEIAQGFCRTCAVNGGMYILGRPVTSLQRINNAVVSTSHSEDPSQSPMRWTIDLDGIPDTLSASILLTGLEDLPSQLRPPNIDPGDAHAMSCTVFVTDTPPMVSNAPQSDVSTSGQAATPIPASEPDNEPTEAGTVGEPDPSQPGSGPAVESATTTGTSLQHPSPGPDDALVTFPPGSVPGGTLPRAVRALSSGPKSNSTPVGRWITQVFAADCRDPTLLQPYVDAILDGRSALHSWSFVARSSAPGPAPATLDPALILVDTLPLAVPAEIGDAATLAARKAYWATMRILRPLVDIEADEDAIWPAEAADEKEDRDARDEDVW